MPLRHDWPQITLHERLIFVSLQKEIPDEVSTSSLIPYRLLSTVPLSRGQSPAPLCREPLRRVCQIRRIVDCCTVSIKCYFKF